MPNTAPLWALCTLNDETLSEKTDSTLAFDYVDISNVTEGSINDDLESLTFATAPSRARRIARDGDVIVSTVRTYLRAIAQVGKAERQRIYSTGFAVLRPDTIVTDPRYVAYVLGSDQVMDEIVATSVGVSYPAIQGSSLHRIRVPHHDLVTQQRIADFLDRETGEIDEMIAKMDELARMLDARRNAAIDCAFVDDFISSSASVHLMADVTVGIVIEPSKLYVPAGTGVPALRGINVAAGQIRADDMVNISHEGHSQNQKSALHEGDLVTVRTGQAGVTAVIPSEWHGANAIDLVITRPHDELSAQYLYWFMSSSLAKDQMNAETVGAVQAHFNVGGLKRLRLPVVDRDEQQRIADHLDEVTSRIDQMLAKVAELKSLLTERRAALITDVVTGQKEMA